MKSVRAHLLKEDLQQVWDYAQPIWAGQFLDAWHTTMLRSRTEPVQKIASLCQRH